MKSVVVPWVLLSLLVAAAHLPAQTVTTLYSFNGLAAGDGLGFSVASAGDVNKDGYVDLIVGAWLADPGGQANAGQATVFSGRDGSVLHTFNGRTAGENFGLPVAGAGDVDNDGYADLIVGAHKAAPGAVTNAGQATVFSGRDGSVLHTFNGVAVNDFFGRYVASAGDVNKDGHADLLVSAFRADPNALVDAGQVKVLSGKDGSTLFTFDGLAAGDEFGEGLASAGDVNKDGYPDIVVGAPHADPGGRTSAGQVRVFSGKDGSTLYTLNGAAASDYFGYNAVAAAGDVNRDGFADFLVGAYATDPGARTNAGQATVFSGQDGSVLHTFNGLAAGDGLGYTVAAAGDVNRDGFPDFLVGAHGADPGGLSGAGQATVFSGKDGSVLHTLNGLAAGNEFGLSVAGAGDVNRDGFCDLIVGAWKASPGGLSGAGQATVFSVITPATVSGSGNPGVGGTIVLQVASPGDAALPYQLASSFGNGPILIDTRPLELSPDPLLFLTILGGAPGVFPNYAGVLDAQGQAKAAIHIPNLPALKGIRIFTAFVTLQPTAPSGVASISNTFMFSIQ
ncbi:MAG: FG-GAP repeat protein [Planctomycetes bacterium]|nr:FG-GAP repeat protein [Planctomycetota bacterium]